MSALLTTIICLAVPLLIISFLIASILWASKEKTGTRTKVSVEIKNILKVDFEQENQK